MSKKPPTITVDEWRSEIERLRESQTIKNAVLLNDMAAEMGVNKSRFRVWVQTRFDTFMAGSPKTRGHLSLAVTPADAVKICQQRAAEGYQIK